MNYEIMHLLKELKSRHPFPWLIDQNNETGIEIRSSVGDMVFFENFYSPFEDASEIQKQIHRDRVETTRLVARLLVALTESEQ